MLSALHELPVHPGDTVHVPAGLAHAIRAGVLLLGAAAGRGPVPTARARQIRGRRRARRTPRHRLRGGGVLRTARGPVFGRARPAARPLGRRPRPPLLRPTASSGRSCTRGVSSTPSSTRASRCSSWSTAPVGWPGAVRTAASCMCAPGPPSPSRTAPARRACAGTCTSCAAARRPDPPSDSATPVLGPQSASGSAGRRLASAAGGARPTPHGGGPPSHSPKSTAARCCCSPLGRPDTAPVLPLLPRRGLRRQESAARRAAWASSIWSSVMTRGDRSRGWPGRSGGAHAGVEHQVRAATGSVPAGT